MLTKIKNRDLAGKSKSFSKLLCSPAGKGNVKIGKRLLALDTEMASLGYKKRIST
jgi:hypothetical protein